MSNMEERKVELNLENLSRLCRKMVSEGKPAFCLMVPKGFSAQADKILSSDFSDVPDDVFYDISYLAVKETTLLKPGGWWLVDEGGGIWEPEEVSPEKSCKDCCNPDRKIDGFCGSMIMWKGETPCERWEPEEME